MSSAEDAGRDGDAPVHARRWPASHRIDSRALVPVHGHAGWKITAV